MLQEVEEAVAEEGVGRDEQMPKLKQISGSTRAIQQAKADKGCSGSYVIIKKIEIIKK